MRNLGTWGTAALASAALHVLVVAIFMGMRGCGPAESAPQAETVQTDGRADDLPGTRDDLPGTRDDLPGARDEQAEGGAQERRQSERGNADRKQAERKPLEGKPSERGNADRKQAERKPSEGKPSERGNADRKQAERKPSERKPSEGGQAERKSEAPKGDEAAADGWTAYKVRPGDSLTRIAHSHGCTVHELAKANKISPTANLMIGQTIKVRNAEGGARD